MTVFRHSGPGEQYETIRITRIAADDVVALSG
jgi:hypothetical protein